MAFLRTRWWLPLLMLGALLGACRGDPKDPQFWVKEMQTAKRPQDRVRILDDLRKSEHLTKDFLPMLHEQLASQKTPETKAAIARILAQLKDPSSVQPLIEAVDTGSSGSAGDRMNREIAHALGELGDARAVQPLLKLLNSRDPFLQLQAAESLGRLKSREAVGQLLALAQDDSKEALVANRAITALGEIGDPSVVQQLIQLMFQQRGPASLYEPAGFALYRMGKPAADGLLPVLAGTDEKLQSWARRHDIAQAALYAKSAQLLGYLLDTRAEPHLLQRLNFAAEDLTQQSYVRLTAADSLGRLRSKDAIKSLIPLLKEEEVMVHAAYLRALGRIGGRDAIPALTAAAGTGMWEQRSPALDALALVGDSRELPAIEALAQSEGERVKTECADSQDASLCKKQDELTQRRGEVYKSRIAMLKAGDKCGEKDSCWAEALGDANAGVRERAALFLGRAGQAAHVQALIKRVGDPDREARLATLQAIDWLTQGNAEAVRMAKAALPALQEQLTHDEGKSDWVEASDNLKRLIAKLSRG